MLGSVSFQPYQMVNLMQALWKSPDKSLLEFLYPMSIRNGWEIFFIRYLPVSANRFRPLMKASGFGGGGGGAGEGTLHNRTNALLNILGVVEKMQFAIGVLKNVRFRISCRKKMLLLSSLFFYILKYWFNKL